MLCGWVLWWRILSWQFIAVGGVSEHPFVSFGMSDRLSLNSPRFGQRGFKKSSLRHHSVACQLSCSVTQTHTQSIKLHRIWCWGTTRNTRRFPVPSDFSYRGCTLGVSVTDAAVWNQLSKSLPFLTCFLFIQELIEIYTHLFLWWNLTVIMCKVVKCEHKL